MARIITKQGATVKGALAAYLVPRIATDKALKPGELDKLFMDKKLTVAPFKKQIPVLADAAKALVKDRLAKDADVEDLEELLEALGEEDLGEDKDKGLVKDEDDMATDADPGEELMKCLAECNIPEDLLEKINGLVSQLGKPAGAAQDDAGGKPGEEKPAKKPDNAAPMKEVPVQKPAMDAAIKTATDAAIKTATDAAVKATKDTMAALFTAANDVKPHVGHVDALAFDSADAIYKMALDQMGVKTEGVHPSAYKELLRLAVERPAASSAVIADDASVTDFDKMYTHRPAQV
jgi:hypothetical protein